MNLRERIAAHEGEIVLRLTEDFRYQFWLTPFASAAELEAWWVSQGSFNPKPTKVSALLYEVFSETPPPPEPYRDSDVPGEFLDEQWSRDDDLRGELDALKKHYRAFICCDSDSYLQRPDGSRIYHRGSCDAERNDAAI
jgi:hypothetical protein